MLQRAAPIKPDRTDRAALLRALLFLWLTGVCLRLTILAIPPVVTQIQAELKLSATAIGLLNSLPAAMFAMAALPGSVLIAALGTRRTLIVGLVLVSLGSACRGFASGSLLLFASSAVMGAGVAMMQPAMPAVVRQWAPQRIGVATAVYTNGLLAGEVFPVILTGPFLLAALAKSWRATLLAWSIPVAAVALLVWCCAPATPQAVGLAERVRPDWRSGLIWRLALLFGAVNSLYFTANAFIPGYLAAQGRPDWIHSALAALNFGQIPASFLLIVFAENLQRRAWPFCAAGVGALLGIAGVLLLPGPGASAAAGLLGFSCATALILALTLPALLTPVEAVAVTSASVFTLSYASAVATALFSGLVWDLTGVPGAAFVPLMLCALVLCGMPTVLVRFNELR